MRQRDIRLLVFIVLLTAFVAWVSWPGNPGIHFRIGEKSIDRDIKTSLGLDLQGGMQVLLEADLPADQTVEADWMAAAKRIVESRVNGLGVAEPIVQSVGNRRILVELPGIEDPQTAIATLKQTGLMEWVDTGAVYLQPGTLIKTDLSTSVEASEEVTPTEPIYNTVLTGRDLKTARVDFQEGFPLIAFELNEEGGRIFAEHTANNIGSYLPIVLDKVVISCPRILGQDSIERSIRAGTIGLIIVLLFMLISYRLPGLLADIALIIYALLTMAIFKLIPITLTLPGIAGFLLSVGMAVDANILIFERMREELRQGRTLQRAIEAGFRRAWTSIFDSNLSTWITCLILWMFGNSFGASIVKGFAVTLAIGVLVSMFTAVTVTRTFILAAFTIGGDKLREHKWLLGV